MAKVSWGKPTIEFAELGGSGATTYTSIPDSIVHQSTTIEAQEGETLTAQVEGGEIFDTRTTAAGYTLTFDVWDAAGTTPPISEEDAASKEYSFRVVPEDPTCNGYAMPRCRVAMTRAFTTGEGGKVHYVVTALKPAEGSKLISYKRNA